MIGLKTCRDFSFPFVSVIQQLLLVVHQLFMGFSGEFKIRTLNNCINRACLLQSTISEFSFLFNDYLKSKITYLAKATVDAFCHINVISSGSSASICTGLCLNCDGLSRTNGFTQFTSNAALFSRGIPSEGMFPSESRTKRSFLKWIVYSCWLFEKVCKSHSKTWHM